LHGQRLRYGMQTQTHHTGKRMEVTIKPILIEGQPALSLDSLNS